MNYRILLAATLGALALGACSKDQPAAAALNCNDPAMATAVQQQLQQAITQSARQFAQTDSRQFIDADKIIAAASQLSVNLADAKEDSSGSKAMCSAQLNITVAADTWQQAQANTPILYPQQQLAAILQGQITGSNVQINGSTFSQPLRYLPAAPAASGSGTLEIEAPGVAQLSHILTNALLPYGVKDTLIINGKAYSRTEALNVINNPNAEPVETLSPEAAMASAILNGAGLPPQDTPPAQETAPSANELQQAQDNNRNANNSINQLWRNMDDMVRGELHSEQQQWVSRKERQCSEAAAKGSGAQADYLRLQCDTRLTNERINYLRGFSVP